MTKHVQPTPIEQPSESALSWGHPGLDRICQSLTDFESLLIVFRDPAQLKWAHGLVRKSLIPRSLEAGLVLSEVQLTPESVGNLKEQLETENPDAVVAISSESDRDRLNLLCSHINHYPVAVIAIFQSMPNRWELFFENYVEISEGTAILRWRDGRTPVQIPFSVSEEIVQPQIRGLKNRLVIVGSDSKRESILRSILESADCEVTRSDVNDSSIEGAALVVYDQPWVGTETEAEIQRLSSLSTVLVVSPVPMRTEDRVRCYRAGARLVLSDASAIEELAAVVNAYLFPKLRRSDSFEQLDYESRRAFARVRRETFWKKEDVERAVSLYQPILANHFRRAQLLDSEVIAILVQLPAPPDEITAKGWEAVFQKGLVSSLVSGLRARDLTFIVDETLVVVMSAVHSIATRPVLKRMREQVSQLGASHLRAEVLVKKTSAESNANDEAVKVIRELFGPNKFQYKELSSWLKTET